ncbi:hypothetical protein QIG59_28105, partial [Klebsiella pneumoniae]|nr:hypothetical protein [Klebsiella pneumoniae]
LCRKVPRSHQPVKCSAATLGRQPLPNRTGILSMTARPHYGVDEIPWETTMRITGKAILATVFGALMSAQASA